MLFSVSKSDERFDQRTQRNRLVRVIPTGGQDGSSVSIQEEKRDVPALEVTL